MKSFFLLAALACASTVFADNEIHVRGKVQFTDPGFKIVACRYEGFQRDTLATCEVRPDQTYEMKIPVDRPSVVTLNCANWQSVNVWMEDENLDVDFRGKDTARIKIKNPPFVYIKGGKNNELMNWINFESYRNYQQMIAVSQAAYRAQFTSEDERQSLSMKLYDHGNENYVEHLRYLVKHYADRTAVMAAIRGLNFEEDSVLIKQALNTLKKANSGATAFAEAYMKEKSEALARKKRMEPGSVLPAFDCFSEDGTPVRISDFKGKAVVLDFWASWCGPCRQEIPNLKAVYEEFKDKGVAFLSVSIDGKKADWTKALQDEQMPWTQAWVKDSGKAVMNTMQFSGIPFILVLDQEGRIYRKNVRGKQIKDTLKEVLEGKPVQKPAKSTVSVSMGAMM